MTAARTPTQAQALRAAALDHAVTLASAAAPHVGFDGELVIRVAQRFEQYLKGETPTDHPSDTTEEDS